MSYSLPLVNDRGGEGQSLCGIPMSQNRIAVPTWSYAIDRYKPRRIIDLGTNNGGFAVFLGIHAWRIGAVVHSFDLCQAPSTELLPLTNVLPIHFHRANHREVADTFIRVLIETQGVSYVLCDGGSKVWEFNTFSDMLKPGDVIGVHDYHVKDEFWPWGEIKQTDCSAAVERNHLVPFHQEYFDCAGWIVFRKE
jgi:cephalosporin hydroxylase